MRFAGGEEANYYALLDQYIAMGKAPVSQPEFMEGKRQMIETEEYFDMIQEDEEEEKKLIDATRRLIITQEKEGEIFHGDYEEVEVEEREQWDAESILSTYSNIYNRPSIIHDGKDRRIKLHPVTGVPMIGGAKQAEMDSVGEGAEDDEVMNLVPTPSCSVILHMHMPPTVRANAPHCPQIFPVEAADSVPGG